MDLPYLTHQPEILDAICKNLTSPEIIELYKSLKTPELNCNLPVNDINNQISFLYPVNDKTIQLYQLILESGSIQTLISVVSWGYLEMVRQLLNSGMDVETKNLRGEVILMTAAHFGHLEIVQELLNRGADVNATTDYGLMTALMQATLVDTPVILQEMDKLYKNVEGVLTEDEREELELKAVKNAKHNSAEVTRELLNRGADVNMINRNGMTALMFAASSGLLETIQVLLDHGANINDGNQIGVTALLLAIENNHYEVVQKLLDHGADIRQSDITHAHFYMRFEIYDLLQEYKARRDQQLQQIYQSRSPTRSPARSPTPN